MNKIIKDQQGMTFIEILIVVIILGIISTLVISSGLKTGADSAELIGQTRNLMSDIRLLREKTIAENRSYGIIISNNNYKLCNVTYNAVTSSYDYSPYETVTLKRGIVVSTPSISFRFETNGNVGGSGPFPYNIVLKDPQAKEKRLRVNEVGLVEMI